MVESMKKRAVTRELARYSLRRMRAPLHATSNVFHSREGARRSQTLLGEFVSRRKHAIRRGEIVTNREGEEFFREAAEAIFPVNLSAMTRAPAGSFSFLGRIEQDQGNRAIRGF